MCIYTLFNKQKSYTLLYEERELDINIEYCIYRV